MKPTALLLSTLLCLSACVAVPSATPAVETPAAAPEPLPYPAPDAQTQIDRLGIEVARLSQQIDALSNRIRQLENTPSAPTRTTAPARPQTAAATPRTTTVPAPAPTRNPNTERYADAQQQYRSGNYAAAINLLSFAESGGSGSETDRMGMYLLLQSHQRLANCESVINIGNRYSSRFRNSSEAPEALYSVGQCQQRMQQRDIARDTWRKLIQTYPDSSAAKRAYRQLNTR